MSETIPFTLLEEMTLHLDRRFEPWNMQGELESSGTVDVERLESAAERAMGLHPLSRARRRPARLGDDRYTWEIPDDPSPVEVRVVDSGDEDLRTVRNRLYGRRFDLTEEPPFDIVVYRGGGIDGGDLVLQSTSHVAADGVGTLRFGDSVWTAYQGKEPWADSVGLRESRSVLRDIDLSSLADGVDAIGSLSRHLHKFVEPPARIAADGGTDREGWGYARRYLGEDLTARLVRGRPDGVSVNDVLLSALHLATAEWNEAHGERTRTISVMMPVNLRPPEWFYQVMAMYSTFDSVRTLRVHRRTPERTVEKVSEQTTKAKERDRAASLFRALRLLPPGLPVGLKGQLPDLLTGPGRRLTDTVLLTNLGNIPAYPSLGEDTEERAWFSPPTWEATPVGFGVGTFAGEVNLFCRYLLSHFDGDAAERFVDGYVDHITRLVDDVLPGMVDD